MLKFQVSLLDFNHLPPVSIPYAATLLTAVLGWLAIPVDGLWNVGEDGFFSSAEAWMGLFCVGVQPAFLRECIRVVSPYISHPG